MAKGKFFNGKVKKDRSKLIKISLISIGLLVIVILIALIATKGKKKDAELVLKNPMIIEVNSKMPNIKDFFSTFKNYKEKNVNIGEFDISKVGSYEVEVSTKDYGTQVITVNIVDTTPPELKVKDLKIKFGEKYTTEDFIESCSDNSKTECIVQYDPNSIDENGKQIDYSSYFRPGEYIVKIIAQDTNENITIPYEAKLIIAQAEGENENPPVIPEEPEKTCTYGDLTIDTTLYAFPIAVIAGDKNSGCAINRDLWDSDEIVETVNTFYNVDYQRLKKQLEVVLKTQYPYGTNIVAYPQYSAILNEARTGLVGYSIYVTVYVSDARIEENVDQQKNLKLAYYIKSDSSREYKVNEFNLTN